MSETRKRKWQKEKLATDSDYREAQAKAQKEWSSKNKDYWKEYRKRNPAYTERNRKKQRQRNLLRGLKPEMAKIAKMDEHKSKGHIPRPLPANPSLRKIAKMDDAHRRNRRRSRDSSVQRRVIAKRGLASHFSGLPVNLSWMKDEAE